MLLGSAQDRRAGVVLFVDDEGWAAFDQTAAAVRRRGLRVIRVTASAPARFRQIFREPYLRWIADRLLYNEVISLDRAKGRQRLAELAASGAISDAIIAEPALLKLGLDSVEGETLSANSLAFRTTPAATMMDKFAVNEALAAAGVPTPQQLGGDISPAEVVERLGLPLIMKAPIGAAGYGVRMVRSFPELEEAVTSLRAAGQQPFYQEYIPGQVVMYAAVLGPGGRPMIEHGFRVEQAQGDLGPSAAVSLHDSKALIDVGRQAAALFQPQGFAAFGFMETPGGQLFHIDANMRAWGNIASPLKLGIDYLEAYVALAKGKPVASEVEGSPASSVLKVYPYAMFEAIRSGSLAEIAANTGDFLRVCHASLGKRYCLQALGQAALHTRRRLRTLVK